MGSAKTISQTISVLKQTYRIDGEEITADWSRLLEGMTDAQIATAREYMREKYTSSYAPAMALFKTWGGGDDHERAWWKTQTVEEFRDSDDRPHVFAQEGQNKKGKLVKRPILIPRTAKKPIRLSDHEYRQRLIDLGAVMHGKLKGTDWSRFKRLRPEDSVLRTELRALMGWAPGPGHVGIERALPREPGDEE